VIYPAGLTERISSLDDSDAKPAINVC